MRYFLLLLFVFPNRLCVAQLTITPGASIYLTGNATLTLSDMSLINDGIFSRGASTVIFSGTSNNTISGSGEIPFYELIINKSNDAEVNLQQSVSVYNQLLFINGNLIIGNHNVDLGRSGILVSESEQKRIRSSGTGQVIAARTLNGAVNAMPGNMGLSISTNENLGEVIFRRGHSTQKGTGLTSSVERYYEIDPQFTPVNANATLRLSYLDAELNGLNENMIQVYQNQNGNSWTALGFTTRHTTQDYVELTGVQAFRRFTLSASAAILPVRFAGINGKCENGKATINWQTSQEQNSLQFEVQRSSGSGWTVAGKVPAAGNSGVNRSYSFTDDHAMHDALYRIAEISTDGAVQYSTILRLQCNAGSNIRIWPNPVADILHLQFNSAHKQKLLMQLWDAKGALVRVQSVMAQTGSNTLQMSLSGLGSGTYSLSVITTEGQRLLTVPVLKQ